MKVETRAEKEKSNLIIIPPTLENKLFDKVERYVWKLADGIRGTRPEHQKTALIILEALNREHIEFDEIQTIVSSRLYGSNALVDLLEHRRIERTLFQLRAIGAVHYEERTKTWSLLETGKKILTYPEKWFDRKRLPISDFEVATLRRRRKEASVFGICGAGFFTAAEAMGHNGVAWLAFVLLGTAAQSIFISSIENGSYWKELLGWEYEDVTVIKTPPDADIFKASIKL